MQHSPAKVKDRDEDDAVAEAYGHVADGCRKALMVSDLPAAEEEGLRKILHASLQLARQRPLSLQR